MQPPVRDNGDVAVQRDRLIREYGESDAMFVLLRQDESIMEEGSLSVHIFYRDDECFPTAVSLLVPPEIRNDRAA